MKQENLSASIKLVLSHYWAQARLDWRYAIPALLLPGIGNILVFYVPTLIVAILLGKFGESTMPSLQETLPYVAALAGIWLLGEALYRVAIHYIILFQTRSMERLYNQALEYLLQKDLAFFNDNFVGSLTKKSLGYARNFEMIADTLSFQIIANLLPLIFAGVVLWQFSPWLVAALVGFVVVTLLILVPLIRRRQKLVAAREKASNVLSGHISDTITNMSVVHAFAHEQSETKLHNMNVADYIKKAKRSWDYQNLRIDVAVSPMYVLTNTVGLIIALALGGSNATAISAIFVTFSYFANFTRVLWEFNSIYRHIETGLTDAAQFTELLIDEPKINDPDTPEISRIHRGGIAFDNVTFHYADSSGEDPLLNDFNLHIKPGEKVGLVGHSGGGKTTITKLLMRFMDVQEGVIRIDDQDIRAVKQADLRSHIAYVPQEPMLFHRSLSDNIRYGRPQASDQEVLNISKMAHAHEFIEVLSQGYDTLVGERGVKLSGGQRQRVAIARAMIKNAPILVLDEATSALDSESEQLIQDALWTLMEGRTAIVIAHRLSTIQRMDRIVVVEHGNIVEEGSHKELLARSGVYAKLWQRQSGGFIEE